MSCERRFDVGVYLLGALDPAERAACEEHLQECADCTAELRRLGGLPGLLARATWSGSAEGADPGQEEPDGPPPGLLDGVHARVRRGRRLRGLLAAASAVVLLAVGVVVGMAVGSPSSSDPAGSTGPVTITSPVRTVALEATGGAPVRGEAGLTDRPWGTAITLRCRALAARDAHPPAYPTRVVYVLLVRGPDGSEEQVAAWSPPPGQDVDVQAATNLTPAAVAGLEVRTGSGELVLAG